MSLYNAARTLHVLWGFATMGSPLGMMLSDRSSKRRYICYIPPGLTLLTYAILNRRCALSMLEDRLCDIKDEERHAPVFISTLMLTMSRLLQTYYVDGHDTIKRMINVTQFQLVELPIVCALYYFGI